MALTIEVYQCDSCGKTFKAGDEITMEIIFQVVDNLGKARQSEEERVTHSECPGGGEDG